MRGNVLMDSSFFAWSRMCFVGALVFCVFIGLYFQVVDVGRLVP